MGEESSAAVQGGPRNLKEKSNEEIRELYDNAVWYASRCSLLGAGGFGVALVMFSMLSQTSNFRDILFGTEQPLAHFLMLGGLIGGALFSFIAFRYSRLARLCEEQLDD